MKVKRLKHVRKVLLFYKNHFDIHPPYYVLVDGTFCRTALTEKVHIGDTLPRYLESEVVMCTTTCAIKECEALGSLLYGPLKILKQYEVVSCGHKDGTTPALCLSMIARRQKKERRKYIIGTQDRELAEYVEKAVGVPLLHMSHKAMVLEGPSAKSRQKAETLEQEKVLPSDQQFRTLEKLKLEVFGPKEELQKKNKRKLKGPNPLSCKKKSTAKKRPNSDNKSPDKPAKKRVRKRRKKVAEHVKLAQSGSSQS